MEILQYYNYEIFWLSAKGFVTLSAIGCLMYLCITHDIFSFINSTKPYNLEKAADLPKTAKSSEGIHNNYDIKPEKRKYLTKSEDVPNKTNSSKPIRIHFYNKPGWIKREPFKECSFNCYMTTGKGYPTSEFVIFHGAFNLPSRPPKKSPGQTWIYYCLEPPVFSSGNLRAWKGKFNWTLSYRRDADFTHTYRRFISQYNETKTLSGKWENKTNGVAWFVSHQYTPSQRSLFAKKMSESIKVDIYGLFSKLKCPSRQHRNCYKLLQQKYKFYLSFENSLCRDYISEKAFNIYSHKEAEVIPVVRGVQNYSLYLPPHSYIDTSKFPNIASMTKFQSALGRNRSEFEKYFWWHKYCYNAPPGDFSLCALCKQAHSASSYRRLYNDIYSWWWGSGSGKMCRNPTDIR